MVRRKTFQSCNCTRYSLLNLPLDFQLGRVTWISKKTMSMTLITIRNSALSAGIHAQASVVDLTRDVSGGSCLQKPFVLCMLDPRQPSWVLSSRSEHFEIQNINPGIQSDPKKNQKKKHTPQPLRRPLRWQWPGSGRCQAKRSPSHGQSERASSWTPWPPAENNASNMDHLPNISVYSPQFWGKKTWVIHEFFWVAVNHGPIWAEDDSRLDRGRSGWPKK